MSNITMTDKRSVVRPAQLRKCSCLELIVYERAHWPEKQILTLSRRYQIKKHGVQVHASTIEFEISTGNDHQQNYLTTDTIHLKSYSMRFPFD